ncbi:[acyl-carrier-protein] S-malonyltransferase [Actimicrobium sp. GrIS 1.19]|uniref:ACP S-malonyltransferase n=1 Tax=Actimicrobium sp. GrIS 1.19 TaxID=3071708 RepID=UPI002E0C3287|nr:[acyl-carrier-protein] S-malonyltransferase [Actimicrobium sp. GrIS 1.19]
MTLRFAILCPGQGGQTAALFALTPDAPRPALAEPIEHILNDPALLFANRHAQPLIVAAGLARWQALRAHIPPPALVAGYSVGELTAYGVADALPSDALLALAVQRAVLMDACVDPALPQVMLAIGGIGHAEAALLLREHGMVVAIDNGADRMIAGGLARDAAALETALARAGASCQRLRVEVASHTPWMAGAQAGFATALAQHDWHACAVPVLGGVRAERIQTPLAAQAALVDQLASPIGWADCMDALVECGIAVALELGPGDALSRMLRERHPGLECRSLDAFRSIDAAAAWLQRRIA